MKLFIFFFLSQILMGVCLAQKMEIHWNSSFAKELSVTCRPDETLCEEICGSADSCLIEEGPCQSCIGTGLQMYHIFSSIGRSLSRQERHRPQELLSLLLLGNFVTLSSLDVFNIIDGYNSIGVLRKFESLCPEESLNQIVFFRTDPRTRKIYSAEYLYCEFFDGHHYFKIRDKVLVEKGRELRPEPGVKIF
jgi:hypothetical protein